MAKENKLWNDFVHNVFDIDKNMSVPDYIVNRVLAPTVKNFISDMLYGAADACSYYLGVGNGRRRTGNNQNGYDYSSRYRNNNSTTQNKATNIQRRRSNKENHGNDNRRIRLLSKII